jgi:hypothetical protein
MPAVSQKQQQLAAIALHNPSRLRDRSILSMGKEDLRKFASTSHKGLPKKKKKKKTGLKRLV